MPNNYEGGNAMSLKIFVLTYIASALFFLVIDFIWLGLIAKGFYQRQIGFLMADKVNWVAACLFYGIFVLGTMIFCIYPAVIRQSFWMALGLGAMFGLVTYATYDLTNLATLRDWPIAIVIVDILWGMVLCGAVSGFGWGMAGWMSRQ